MNFVILSMILIMITWPLYSKYIWKEKPQYVILFVAYNMVLIIAAILIFHAIFNPVKRDLKKHLYYIESLGNDKYTEGSFMLGSGSIETIDYYFFYVNTINGYKRLKTPVCDTYIIETDNKRPEYIQVYNTWDDEDMFLKVFLDDVTYRILYVPKNTIIKDFKVR